MPTQQKAARLVKTYGNPTHGALRMVLGEYYGQMSAGARKILAAFMDDHAHKEHKVEESRTLLSLLAPSARVELPKTLDDVLFLLSAAFVQPQVYHISLVPEVLYVFREQMGDVFIGRLGPAIKAPDLC